MRVAILGEPGGWHVDRLSAALRRRDHHVAVIRWAELTAGVGPAGASFGPEDLANAHVIVVRGMPGAPAAAHRLEDVIFRMDALGHLAAQGMPVINPPRALEIAIDKYLSLAVLAQAGIPIPRTVVVQDAAAAVRGWDELGRDCVAKPIFGSRGRGLMRVTSADEAAALLPAAEGGIAYLQEFIGHPGWDVRILVVGNQTFSMKRVAAEGDWRTNISRGARPEAFEPPVAWTELAVRSASAIGATIAGIDLLPTADGRPLVVEVNGVPAWHGLQSVVGTDVAAAMVAEIERSAGHRPSGTGP
ncbi:MAG: RimK family alpha-L-glutamate ligase [Planctomycetia bacterium]|nr:RimK family alpha-L-glutamate ligase [Planctomycetia bacterium]